MTHKNKQQNKQKKNKNILTIMAAVIIVLLAVAAVFFLNSDQPASDTGTTDDDNTAETVTVNEPIQITLSGLLSKFKNQETFAVILIMDGCPWCEAAYPVFEDVTADNTAKTYYVNFTDAGSEDDYEANFNELETYLTDYLAVEDGETVFYIPHAFFVKAGEILYDHVGTVSTHDPYTAPMTDEETAELSGYFQEGFDDIQ